jgi:nitrite reductase (NO-forming)/hydroxylamine reductase
VHISRLSKSGRYVYVIGRDGRLSLIDLWMEKPGVVAEVKIGFDARSVDTSKFKGFEDTYAIAGSYWPPQYVIMDGDTLKPRKVVSTRGMTVDGEYHPEPRVASIVASEIKPEWVVNIKETGQILLVDYSDIENLKTTTIGSAKFLHDGGFDASKRYFLVAANASNKIAAVDLKTGKLAALVTPPRFRTQVVVRTLFIPSLARFGQPGHLGADVVTLISTPSDDKKYAKFKEFNWKVVQEVKHVPGNLFVKTHPKSNHLWADSAQNSDKETAESVSVWKMGDLSKPFKTINVAKDSGLPETKATRRAVHPEYSADGTEVWISLWGGKTDQSAIVVYDDKTLALKKVITDPKMITPTGKFNVYNTQHDIYSIIRRVPRGWRGSAPPFIAFNWSLESLECLNGVKISNPVGNIEETEREVFLDCPADGWFLLRCLFSGVVSTPQWKRQTPWNFAFPATKCGTTSIRNTSKPFTTAIAPACGPCVPIAMYPKTGRTKWCAKFKPVPRCGAS